jgi:iron-sulfur cluster repair protein YtfE (RIC family)
MSTNTTPIHAAELVQEDHLALRQRIRHLQETFQGPRSSAAELWRELRALELELSEHFRHEESEGFFDSILDAMPECAEQIAALQRQHERFRTDIAAMKGVCRDSALDERQRAELTSDFASFMASFDGHEHAEFRLVQEAVNRDLGSAD